ncbi:MAG: dihydrofolate reductase family protein [Spirochaetia bacterium]|nr:dihydrofolate reductase family protein [Spirochaetia bacterium]
MKTNVYIASSLDGYIARTDGGLDWLSIAEKEGEDYGFSKFFSSIDTIVMGRNTFDIVKEFKPWPYSEKQCIIYTSRPAEVLHNEKYFSGSISELYEFIQKSGADNVYADGGRLIQGFLEHDYIDEITISIIPILLGDGIPLFGKMQKNIKLHLMESVRFETGLVQVRYRLK